VNGKVSGVGFSDEFRLGFHVYRFDPVAHACFEGPVKRSPLDHTRVKSVLFLCTGNYYRSRFAEELFNHRAERDGLRWAASSRGLAIERGIFNVGPLSAHVIEALTGRGLAPRTANRVPQQCTRADLQAADHIVALKEAEHRPLLIERFPGWEDRVEYWHIHDVIDAAPAAALGSIGVQIDLLVDRLV